MSEIARQPVAGLNPVAPGLAVEVLDWVEALRLVWVDTGLSINRFARMHPIDKGSVSRYLKGERVPLHPWFLNRLLDIRAENGKPVAPDVRQHLTELHLRALQVKHPHEYRVRLISNQLEIAKTREQEMMNRLQNDVSRLDCEIVGVESEIKLLELFRQSGSWVAYGAYVRSGEAEQDAAKIAELQCKLGSLRKDHQELTKIIALYSGFDTVTSCGRDIVPYSKRKDIVPYGGRTYPYDLHRWPLQIERTTSSV